MTDTCLCTCARAESAHHHAFGGTYPCEGPRDCIRCQPIERQQPNGRGDLETRGPKAQAQLGADYIRGRYGPEKVDETWRSYGAPRDPVFEVYDASGDEETR